MKLGFIGGGFIARFQGAAIQQVRGLEIAGMLRRRGSEALAALFRSQRLGEAKLYDSIGDLAPNVDVLAIYVPNYCRIEVMEEIVAAVKAGGRLMGVVLEKPLGRNMREARRLVELAREAKLPTAYAFEINTLVSPLNVFIGDVAAQSVADQESALEKATASRGLLAVQYNEADLYGYTDENRDMLESFSAGRSALLSWEYGLEIQRLVMASYLSAERRCAIDLTDPAVVRELDDYVPAIQQGNGHAQLC